jgi:hypothetical protein
MHLAKKLNKPATQAILKEDRVSEFADKHAGQIAQWGSLVFLLGQRRE